MLPVTDDQMSKAATKVIHIPVIIGTDVPAYNLPPMTSDLRFTPDVLAKIFLGQITNWNDAAMRAANPGVPYPRSPSSSCIAPTAAALHTCGPSICQKSAPIGSNA